MSLSEIIIIRAYVPVGKAGADLSTFKLLTKACPALVSMLALIDRSASIGVLGNYRSVFELQCGFEGYTPALGANPNKGQPNKKEVVRSVLLSTYVSSRCKPEVLERFLQELAEVHPWEHPVIEVVRGRGVKVWAAAKAKKPGKTRYL